MCAGEFGSRPHAELVIQSLPEIFIDLQGVCLLASCRQAHHQLGISALVQRLALGQCPQVR